LAVLGVQTWDIPQKVTLNVTVYRQFMSAKKAAKVDAFWRSAETNGS
jgi:hypothetical protein